MNDVVDFTKAPEEILVTLINIDNATGFVVGDLSFDFPKVNADIDASQYNTQIMAWGGNTGKHSGRVLLKYNKALLDNFFPEFGDLIFLREKDNNLRDFTARVSERLGIRLFDRDLKDAKLPTVAFEENITFEASDDSLIYRGSSTFRVRQPTDLAIALSNFYLDGISTAAIVPQMTAEQLIFDQLSIDNPNAPYAFNSDSVELIGPPVIDLGDYYNTRIFLKAKEDYGYKGKVGIYYRRNSIQKIMHEHGYFMEEQPTLTVLLDRINQHAGSYLKAEDLMPVQIPAMQATGQVYTITLTPKSTSLAWNAPGTVKIGYGIPSTISVLHTLVQTELAEWFGELAPVLPINADAFHEFANWTMPNLLDPAIELSDALASDVNKTTNVDYLNVASVPGSAQEFDAYVTTVLPNYYNGTTDELDETVITTAEVNTLQSYLQGSLAGYFQ